MYNMRYYDIVMVESTVYSVSFGFHDAWMLELGKPRWLHKRHLKVVAYIIAVWLNLLVPKLISSYKL